MGLVKENEEKISKHMLLSRTFVISVCSLIVLFFLIVYSADAQSLTIQQYNIVAPSSIPVPEDPSGPADGTDDVAMSSVRFNSTSGTIDILSIEVELQSDNIIAIRDKITSVKVYFDAGPDGPDNGLFDRGGGDDSLAGTSAANPFSGGPPYNIIIPLGGVTSIDSTGFKELFVAFDFAPDTDETTNVGCEILFVNWEETGNPPNNGSDPPGAQNPRDDIDDYEINLTATGIAISPAQGGQGERNVEILKLDFSPTTETGLTTKVDSIRLRRIGTGSDSDIPGGGVLLYLDSGDVSGTFDSADELLDTDTLSGGYVVLDPVSDDAITITSSTVTCFVTLNISVNATVGATIGLEVEDPSIDITFVDIQDNTNPLSPDFADTSVEYLQSGYITSTTITPTSNNTITITLLALELPTPDEPVAANNRILPGQTDPVQIYIPEPPGGPSEKVTVQVYTIAGQRVATLVNNQPYSQISSSLPLEWFGKNQKQKDLGPGLYFIQVKTSSYTKILKVLIVR
jgi:hypothetical protein